MARSRKEIDHLIFKWFLTWFGLGGLFFIGYAVVAAADPLALVISGEHARGEVTDFTDHYERTTSRTGSSQILMHSLVVRFTTAEGQTVTFTNSGGSSGGLPPKGTRVDVLYDPDNPSHATINSAWDLWGFSIGFLFIGLVFCLMGWPMHIMDWRKKHLKHDP